MYQEYINLQKSIEISIEETDYLTIAQKFKALVETVKDERLKKFLVWDYELFSLYGKSSIDNEYTSYFNPMYELADGTKWPNIDLFESERLEFYQECERHTQNLAMKVRYLEYLFEFGRNSRSEKSRFEIAAELVNYLIELGNIKLDGSDLISYLSFYSYISRAIEISMKFKMKDNYGRLENALLYKTRQIVQNKAYRWLFECSTLFFKLTFDSKDKLTHQESIDELLENLENAKEYFFANKEFDFFQTTCKHLIMWARKLKIDEVEVNKLLLSIGEAYELESLYQHGREDKSKIVEAHFLELAIKYYIDIGQSERVQELKVKLKKTYNELSQNGELKIASHKIEIPKEAIDNAINPFIADTAEESLERFALIPNFIPPLDLVRKQANEIAKNNVLMMIASSITFKDGRKISQASSEEEQLSKAINEHYMLHLQLTFISLVQKLFDKMIEQGLTVDMLISRINSWDYMHESKKPIIERGIKRFFDGDYISSIHILVPMYEYCFREFFYQIGYPTTSFKSSTIQYEQTFNDFLTNNTFVKNNINEDELYMIKMIMIEQNGLNLRNNVAHGLAEYDSLNKLINLMVIYLFLLLTRYKIVEKGENAK